MKKERSRLWSVAYALLGLGTLVWFLIRVIPKPSRAAYPCMRLAAPLASSFVLWLLGIASTALFLKEARNRLRKAHYIVAAGCLVAGGIAGAAFLTATHSSFAAFQRGTSRVANNPIGIAKGVNPGRVVWVHDSNATSWKGLGFGHIFDDNNTDQTVVDRMLSQSLRSLSGAASDSASWDALFRYYNRTHGRGDRGYASGEKIAVKINLVWCIFHPEWCSVDTNTGALVAKLDYPNTSPQVVCALLRQLVNVAHVKEADISIGDPVTYYPNEYFDLVHAEFPSVRFMDHLGKFGRVKVRPSTVPFYFSCRPAVEKQDYVPLHFAEAAYMINLANMKSHGSNGITAGAKNHFGSLNRLPFDSGYYNLHETLASSVPQAGTYRALVDLMGSANLGGKTMLYLIDGLYAGSHPTDTVPHKWIAEPFNNDWTSCLLASQDPVAIESVLFDLFELDPDTKQFTKMAGVEDYLAEAAQADNPPSGTFYDPDHAANTVRMQSLGVYEHWNNAIDRKYSRNLGAGNGIELVAVDGTSPAVRKALHAAAPLAHGLRRGPGGTVTISIGESGWVRLIRYDILGRNRGTVLERYLTAGTHTVQAMTSISTSQRYIVVLYRLKNGVYEQSARLNLAAGG
jgi:hypothetical protein